MLVTTHAQDKRKVVTHFTLNKAQDGMNGLELSM